MRTSSSASALLSSALRDVSTITATRELFGNPGVPQDGSWVAANAQLMAVVWPLALVAVFLPLAVRRYRALRR